MPRTLPADPSPRSAECKTCGDQPATPKPPGRGLALAALAASLLALAASGAAGYLLYQRDPTPPPRLEPVAARAGTGLPVTYAKEALDVRIGCSALVYLDLDEPRARAAQQVADLRYDSKCGAVPARLSLGAGAAAGSSVPSTNLDANGCERAIRTRPLGPGAQVVIRKGGALCVLTAGTPHKLVLVEITDVGAAGTAGLRATSWLVPK